MGMREQGWGGEREEEIETLSSLLLLARVLGWARADEGNVQREGMACRRVDGEGA